MFYHLVWIGYDLTHFHGLSSLFWIAMGVWAIIRIRRWHHHRSYRKRGSDE